MNPPGNLSSLWLAAIFAFLASPTWADGPADNIPEQVRAIPPEGIAVPAEKAGALRSQLSALGEKISELKGGGPGARSIEAYLPDVEIYFKAVSDALEYGEFYNPKGVRFCLRTPQDRRQRADWLSEGQTPWTRQTGLVARGYRSRIDGSVQPYGLEIPANYHFDFGQPYRLDFWLHGRGEKLTELSFLQQRSSEKSGKISPPRAIVLHPYGRYSNANKFAGEIDTFEALEHARRDYEIDDDRIFVRGFSMGGAACWQFAVHHAGLWAGAQPGAGFSETPEFLKTFQGKSLAPTWWEKKLWRWYDATEWAINLSNCPTIAYSGENDRQRQAADVMEIAAEKEGLRLLHLIGPQTAHALHPEVLRDIEDRLASISAKGRERVPQTVRFVTHTLRYDRMHWVRIEKMTQHWEPARIEAIWERPNRLKVVTSGTESFSLVFPAGQFPLDPALEPEVTIDGTVLRPAKAWSDLSWQATFVRGSKGKWNVGIGDSDGLTKRHGLQGPIDDAFMDSFLMVAPTGKSPNEKVSTWCASEMEHAMTHWRKQFRGVARMKTDSEVTEEDIASHNLVLWGDPASNRILAKISGQFPIQWSEKQIVVGDRAFDSTNHAVAMIFPNPLNPDRYVVLNSGFTFREYDYLNNARQTPKLPDWAVIDLNVPVTSRRPGGIPAAGFFGEEWELVPQPSN